ncbi:uncharacterized protein BJX67DRAFT_136174 [Aspergillus lucknowensis]|uniref:Uncharacterized protein n=1 Tax=Aspergillus lucknowensis TaxID=176173 RepID=A0ABR4LPF8_9EURO
MALTTARFEKEYDLAYSRTVRLLDAERDRARCVEQLLLRIEIEGLQSRLHHTERELIQARETEADARFQLDRATGELGRLQSAAQTSSREVENLQLELASLNAVSSESQKIQAEKVRISKEVSSLKLEVERLRSQNTSASTLLAEKQTLARQLNGLEVQLENEKRAHERTLAKGSQHMEEIKILKAKLEEARREPDLAPQRQSSTHTKNRPLAVRKEQALDKHESAAKPLEAAMERYQDAVPDLQQPQQVRSAAESKRCSEHTSIDPLRGLASHMNTELTIATPGAVRAKEKQSRNFTLPGQKSSFSVTPFLNRTSGLEGQTMSSDDELNEAQNTGRDSQLSGPPPRVERSGRSPSYSKEPKPSVSDQSYKAGKHGSMKSTLDGDTRIAQRQRLLNSPDEARAHNVSLSRSSTHQAKKRKLGFQRDRSLFDDDDEDNAQQDTRRPGRKPPGLGQAGLAGNRAFTGLAGFSPLKRDKKRF